MKNSQINRVVAFLQNNSEYGFTAKEIAKKAAVRIQAVHNAKYFYPKIVDSEKVGTKNYYMINEEYNSNK